MWPRLSGWVAVNKEKERKQGGGQDIPGMQWEVLPEVPMKAAMCLLNVNTKGTKSRRGVYVHIRAAL